MYAIAGFIARGGGVPAVCRVSAHFRYPEPHDELVDALNANNQFLKDYVRRVGRAAAPEARQSGFEFRFTVLNVSSPDSRS